MKCNEINMKDKIQKWKQNDYLEQWRTYTGKVIISKLFGMSNLIYIMRNTSSNDNDITSAQKVINNFKPSKVQHLTFVADNSKAGSRRRFNYNGKISQVSLAIKDTRQKAI